MKAKHIATALFAAAALAACAAPGAGKAQKKKSAPALDFHDFCSNAWIRCDTDRNFLSYAPDEEMKFTFKQCCIKLHICFLLFKHPQEQRNLFLSCFPAA